MLSTAFHGRLDNLEHARDAIGVQLNIAGRHVAVDDLALDELALEVRRNVVDAAHLAALAGSVAKEAASRAVTERS